MKLRSYDITKIISELNKLNNEGGSVDQSRVKSKPKPSKNENHLPCDGSSGGSISGTAGDVRSGRNLCGLVGDSKSRHAKTTASQQPEAAPAAALTLVKKTAEESHNNRGARQDAVGPVGSCRLAGGGASICENNLPPSSKGRNESRSRCTSEEGTAAISLPASSSTATSSLPNSSLARMRKKSTK